MKTIEKKFKKNGLDYELLERIGDWCLFDLGVGGFEVSKVYTFNNNYFKGESITSNSKFGLDGSKSFFKYDDAKRYFKSICQCNDREINDENVF